MNSISRYISPSIVIVMILLLCACGPSQSQLDETATQEAVSMHSTQTAVAPTSTSTSTSTNTPPPTPTETPTPTITSTPEPTLTPTSTPDPDPNAMIDWKELNLPQNFVALPPGDLGIEQGAMSFGMTVNDEPVIYPIEGNFAFSNDDGQNNTIFGFTIVLPEKVDQDRYDGYISASADPDFTKYSIESSYPGSTNIQAKELPFIENLGDESAGISTSYTFRGSNFQMDSYNFRRNGVGAVVFVRYLNGSDPPVSADKLALVYADSINNRFQSCSLISIRHTGEKGIPVYHIEADGFYPGERRAILISGDIMIDGESKGVTFGALGETEDANRADSQGMISEEVNLGILSGSDIILPNELDVKIIGHYSGCSIDQIVEVIYE